MGQLGRRGSTWGEEKQRGVPPPPRMEERESTLREGEESSWTGAPLEGHVLTTLQPAVSLNDTRPCLKGQAVHADLCFIHDSSVASSSSCWWGRFPPRIVGMPNIRHPIRNRWTWQSHILTAQGKRTPLSMQGHTNVALKSRVNKKGLQCQGVWVPLDPCGIM